MGTVTKRRMIQVLADAAGASKDHQIQLLALLAWLEYAGLITTEGGSVQIATDAPVETPLVDPPPDENATRPADPAGEGTTTEGGRHDPQAKSEVEAEAALSFDFHLALTVDDLRRLSPDQIQALFAAVGTVMSIKTTI
jgi:hypothetical protein